MVWRHGCSALMNFGVLGEEGIEFARVEDDEPGLTHLLDRWKPVGYPLSGLKCFRIETSSTGSVILIYAKSWRIEHLPMADTVKDIRCPDSSARTRFSSPVGCRLKRQSRPACLGS